MIVGPFSGRVLYTVVDKKSIISSKRGRIIFIALATSSGLVRLGCGERLTNETFSSLIRNFCLTRVQKSFLFFQIILLTADGKCTIKAPSFLPNLALR